MVKNMRFFFGQKREKEDKSGARGEEEGRCTRRDKKINVNACNSRADAIRFGNKRGIFSWQQSTSVNYFVYAIFSAKFMAARSEMSIVDLFSNVRACVRRMVLFAITRIDTIAHARIQT